VSSIGGLVQRPGSFALELKGIPSRTQITRHDCVEGWSCIGKWKGVRLAALLDLVGLRQTARYFMFHCADAMNLSGDKYYESIDLDGAYHPQTILACEMNDLALPIAQARRFACAMSANSATRWPNTSMRIEPVEDFARIGDGNGGYLEDQGYEWWAGI
jgi:DMSO/TMAO reductase YedYZ molybdopterin-dependent catalytic subunit